jgi:hypothetical protein
MNVIFGKLNADLVRQTHLVLELETFDAGGKPLECYCLVDSSLIPLAELSQLEHYKKLHQAFVDNLKIKNYKVCRDLIPHLQGKFGGEVDSFYTVIAERIEKDQ